MKKWYDGLYAAEDDALATGLDLLDSLRGALPEGKEEAVNEAKRLLCRAAELYQQAKAQQPDLQDLSDEALLALIRQMRGR